MKKYIHLIIFIACMFLLFSCNQEKTEWKGTIEEIDGVTTIKNPKEPMYKEDGLFIEEELTIGEAVGREEYMFQSLSSLAVNDKGDIFALDTKAQHVKIFDREGLYLRTIGRPGQGPGELYQARSLVFTEHGEIVVGSMNNISYFSAEGVLIKSISLSKVQFLLMDIDIDGYIFGYSIDREQIVYALKKYDPELNELHLIGSSPLPTVEYNQTGKRNAFFTLLTWDIINGDQSVTGCSLEGYVIKLLDTSGNLIQRIETEFTPIKITQKDFEEIIADQPPQFKKDFYAPKYLPPFWTLRADDEGRIWVTTSKKTPDGISRIYDVFNTEGRFIFKVALNASPRVIKNNRMYTIEEDEDGFHFIKRYKLTWNY